LLLRGKLCDERGQALGGEQVVGCALASDQTGTATTKANGAFELCLPCREGDGIAFVLADSHWLLASGDRSHSLPCDLGRHQDTMRIGRDYQLRATRAASIRGRLRLPDGKPAAGVAVHLLHPVETVETPGWPIASARTDADGRFTFPAVHGCGCDLQLCIHEETGYLAETFVADGEQIDLDVLTMKPAATLTGCVRDAAGRAVAGAVISLRRLDAETLSTASAAGEHALTNRDGRYRVRGLEAGEYELTTANHAPGAKPLMRRFRVRPAQQLAIDLALLQ
jgi:5-hydroxyisourate hydrolase-like protein (transthyretin family)